MRVSTSKRAPSGHLHPHIGHEGPYPVAPAHACKLTCQYPVMPYEAEVLKPNRAKFIGIVIDLTSNRSMVESSNETAILSESTLPIGCISQAVAETIRVV